MWKEILEGKAKLNKTTFSSPRKKKNASEHHQRTELKQEQVGNGKSVEVIDERVEERPRVKTIEELFQQLNSMTYLKSRKILNEAEIDGDSMWKFSSFAELEADASTLSDIFVYDLQNDFWCS